MPFKSKKGVGPTEAVEKEIVKKTKDSKDKKSLFFKKKK